MSDANQPELPPEVFEEINDLRQQGDTCLESKDFAGAYAKYHEAWSKLPEPANAWRAGVWLIAAMGDAMFYSGQYSQARELFQQAADYYSAEENPFVRLRLGQTSLELGDEERAKDELLKAFSMVGKMIFSEDDPKYYEFLKSRVSPPVVNGVIQWP